MSQQFQHSNGLTSYTVQFKQPVISGPIFQDKNVFQESYIPERILHRDTQLRGLWEILSDIDRGCRPQNILCMGGLGSGKTVLIRHTCRGLPVGSTVVYVNCSKENTRTRIIMSALDQLGVPVVSGFDSMHYVDLFEQAVKSHRFVGLILDETDKFLDRKDSEHFELFYWLSRLLTNVFTIMLTNRVDFQIRLRETLDPRVLDTFRWRTIVFPDYGCNEILDILWDRFQAGFKQGTYSEDRIEAAIMSKYSYDRGGGAREAIALALRVGETAETHNHTKLEPSDIEEGKRVYEKTKELEFIRCLPKVEKTILSYVLAKEPTSNQAYNWFKDTTEQNQEPSSYSVYQDSLAKLEVKGLVAKEKQPRGRGRGSAPMKLTVPLQMQSLVLEAITDLETMMDLAPHPRLPFLKEKPKHDNHPPPTK